MVFTKIYLLVDATNVRTQNREHFTHLGRKDDGDLHIEGIFRGACQTETKGSMPQGVKNHTDKSKSRKLPDKINTSPRSTKPHGLAELKSLAGFFNTLRSQPSPGGLLMNWNLHFLVNSHKHLWTTLCGEPLPPNQRNCLEPPPLVSKPGERRQGRQAPLQNSQKTWGFLCLQGVVVKFYCWFGEQLILKLSSGRKWETTAWGWVEGT